MGGDLKTNKRGRLVFTITSTWMGRISNKKKMEKRRGIGFETVAGMGGCYRRNTQNEKPVLL